MYKVIMFIEKEKRGPFKGHIFLEGKRVLVTVDQSKEIVKANMEWELNSVFGIDNCMIEWLKA